MSFWCHRFDQNSNENIVRISALKLFVASLGFPGDLLSNIINKKAYRKPQTAAGKPQGIFKNVQGRIPYNISVGLLVETMTPKRHFEINWPLVRKERCALLPFSDMSCQALKILNRKLALYVR